MIWLDNMNGKALMLSNDMNNEFSGQNNEL